MYHGFEWYGRTLEVREVGNPPNSKIHCGACHTRLTINLQTRIDMLVCTAHVAAAFPVDLAWVDEALAVAAADLAVVAVVVLLAVEDLGEEADSEVVVVDPATYIKTIPAPTKATETAAAVPVPVVVVVAVITAMEALLNLVNKLWSVM